MTSLLILKDYVGEIYNPDFLHLSSFYEMGANTAFHIYKHRMTVNRINPAIKLIAN